MADIPGTIPLFEAVWYRRSPYFEASMASGAKAVDVYNNTYLPSYFDDPVNEYWHLVKHVAVWDVGCERQVEISGPDGFEFANFLIPRNLSKCKVGQGKYVVITDDEGGIINDPVLLRLGKNRFWLSASDSDLLLWAKGVAIHSGMDVEIREPDVSPMQVQGPKSKDVLRALLGPKVLDLPYYHFFETTIDGIPVVVTRTGWSAEVGFEIYLCDGRKGVALWRKVMEAGRPFNIRPTGPSDIRRIEAGILNYGSDMTLENNPYEVGLGWLVEEGKKADYIGKRALKKIKKEGVKQKLVGVEIDGPPMGSWLRDVVPVGRGGRLIGEVRAAVHSPRLRKNIGYAMVPIAHAKLGTELTIQMEEGDRNAVVVRKPFLDPTKAIPKS